MSVRGRGLSMLELLLVIAIIGVIGGIAVLRFGAMAERARMSATWATMQEVERAATQYYEVNRAWPVEAASGVCPPGLDKMISSELFEREPPLGVQWDWNGAGAGYGGFEVSISVRARSPSVVWSRFDAAFDDGNLRTGRVVADGTRLVLGLGEGGRRGGKGKLAEDEPDAVSAQVAGAEVKATAKGAE